MKTVMIAAVAAAVAAGVFATAPAEAVVTFHTTQESFTAATINPQATETFETAPTGGNSWYPYGYTGSGFVVVGAGGYTFTVDPHIPRSERWYDWGSGDSLFYGPNGTATFYFTRPVTAFSIDLATLIADAGIVTVAGDGFSTAAPFVTPPRHPPVTPDLIRGPAFPMPHHQPPSARPPLPRRSRRSTNPPPRAPDRLRSRNAVRPP